MKILVEKNKNIRATKKMRDRTAYLTLRIKIFLVFFCLFQIEENMSFVLAQKTGVFKPQADIIKRPIEVVIPETEMPLTKSKKEIFIPNLIWKEDFNTDLHNWQGTLDAFKIKDSRAESCGTAPKDTLFLLRDLWADNELQLYEEDFLKYIPDSGICWYGSFATEFNPSTLNYLRFYLWVRGLADPIGNDKGWIKENDSAVSACYLQLGERGSENRWRLYLQQRGQSRLVWSGEKVYKRSSGGTFDIAWRLDEKGYVHAKGRSNKDSAWSVEGDSTYIAWNEFMPDSIRDKKLYTGFCAVYGTASRAVQYAVDEISLGLGDPVVEEDDPIDPEDPEDPGDPTHNKDWVRPDTSLFKWSEVLFETETGESKFIEFYNGSDSVVTPFWLYVGVENNNSWKWSRLCKDSNVIILPKSYSAWCKDINLLSSNYSPCYDYLFKASTFPTIDASAGYLQWAWFAPQDTVFGEYMRYNKDMHHILLSSVKSVSLERIGFKLPAMDRNNWQSASLSIGGASPGCENSQYNGDLETEEKAMGKYFEFSTKLLTPNGDGINDYTEISWNEALSSYVCSIDLYDSYGRKVRSIVEKEILSTSGRWIYKGDDDKGLVLRSGIYVFYIQLINTNGKCKKLRYALAVG